MRSRVIGYSLLLVFAVVVLSIVERFGSFGSAPRPGEVKEISSGAGSTTASTLVGLVLEEIAHGLVVPWSIVFTSPERMLVTERPGRVRVVENGSLKSEPLYTFQGVSSNEEEGLMGLALHPAYDQNHLLYFSLAYVEPESGKMFVKVVRFRDEWVRLSGETLILDKIPAAKFHAGSRIKFGPDGKLYVTTGDALERDQAQNLSSLAGKILRMNDDGSIPTDNPFPGSPIWSYGHRNPQGLAWHPTTGVLYSTEHGPSGFDGPGGGDEVNRIVKGANYGWPLVSHEARMNGTVAPIAVFTPAEAPASAMIYSGKTFPQWKGNLFFGALAGTGLVRVVIDEQDPDKVLTIEKLEEVQLGRIRAVAEGPDGFIYFSTSNRDGRGEPSSSDDRIMRLRPVVPISN